MQFAETVTVIRFQGIKNILKNFKIVQFFKHRL